MSARSDGGTTPPSLRAVIEGAKTELGLRKLADLTVLSDDPFRMDRPANHRDGRWLADHIARHLPRRLHIHLRGLHYVLVSVEAVKPDGVVYRNTPDDWEWLQEKPAKYARWLKYVPFTFIIDARNDEPSFVEWTPPRAPNPAVYGAYVSGRSDLDALALSLGVPFAHAFFDAAQPYRIAVIGEKSSVGDVLGPLCGRWAADLYLPGGHPTDTMVYRVASIAERLASNAAVDDRPLVVLYFSDCDPSGNDMPRVLARKLQAHKAREFPGLEFEVVQVALTPDQVREYDLPITPLKETEQRADEWKEKTGVEQTEIDALAALRPDLLREIATEAVRPYFDATLASRAATAGGEWKRGAQAQVDASLDRRRFDDLAERVAKAREDFLAELDEVREEAKDLIDPEAIELPPVAIPEPELADRDRPPLIDSRWDWTEQTLRLMRHKRFEPLGPEPSEGP